MKYYFSKKEYFSIIFMLLILFLGFVYTYKNSSIKVSSIPTMLPVSGKTIIVDAGHGGWDPGKTGTNGDNEKDINLEISKILSKYLETVGANVVITRNEDIALGDFKREDMKERKNIANSSDADILVSIHQNSFPNKKTKGAQVFYYKNSEDSKKLAECIQEKLITEVDNDNNRLAKSNTEYYMLKSIDVPSVIVECGFLSNIKEEKLLNQKYYQEKIAWAIYMGIIEYFSNRIEV